jgi:hypothetical protein
MSLSLFVGKGGPTCRMRRDRRLVQVASLPYVQSSLRTVSAVSPVEKVEAAAVGEQRRTYGEGYEGRVGFGQLVEA